MIMFLLWDVLLIGFGFAFGVVVPPIMVGCSQGFVPFIMVVP